MSFAHAAFLLLIIPWAICVYWRCRRRDRQRRVVGTLAIWRLVAQTTAGQIKRRKLPLELILEAALGLILILLLAAPEWRETESPQVLVLVDSGSAMQTPERAEQLATWLEELEAEHQIPIEVRYWPERSDSSICATDAVLWADQLKSLQTPNRRVYLAADAILDLDQIPEAVGIKVIEAEFANLGITSLEFEHGSDALKVHVGLSRSSSWREQEASVLVAAAKSGAVLVRESLPDFKGSRLLTLTLKTPLPEALQLTLEGATGPKFDDRVDFASPGSDRRYAVVDFPGQAAWLAALKACGRDGERFSSGARGTTDWVVIAAASDEAGPGPGIFLGGPIVGAGFRLQVDDDLKSATLMAQAEGPLAGVVGLEELDSKSGNYFLVTEGQLEVLAQRAGRAVILFDRAEQRIYLADAESRADWAESVAFPLLVKEFVEILTPGSNQQPAQSIRCSSVAESQGGAAAASASRPALAVDNREISRSFWLELAALGLLVQGILLFQRRKELRRRESSPAY